MHNFIMREISEKSKVLDDEGVEIEISASRHRNSNGASAIVARFGGDEIRFHSGCEGDEEDQAREFIRVLQAVVDDPCLLPTQEETP